MKQASNGQAYLTSIQVQDRYQISEITLHRWQKDARLSFPKPMVVNRRKFFRVDDLTAWERERAKVSA
ncbi:DNA-binding protein [Sinorhizobium meliloti]|uniref:DNA-binding protein n=1 Tax=Rhizobium meliloti TaxID=382 RepID=UPI000FD4EED4|nr:DNA-binding protein [Sinorhizobium meliloti]RVJ99190.1 DNA-binding protein [Sinorhizobium meliloti]